MIAIKHYLENVFSLLANLSYRRPWWFIAVAALLCLFFIWQLQYVRFETTAEALLEKDDPALIDFSWLKDNFGRNDDIVLSVSGDVFSPVFLQQLIALHQELETQLPYVSKVSSLYNARHIFGRDDELVVEGFLDEFSGSAEQITKLKGKALNHRLYQDRFINKKGDLSHIYITPATYFMQQGETTLVGDIQLHEVLLTLESMLEKYPLMNKGLHLSGIPVINYETILYMSRDIATFIVISLLVIAAMLYFLFRSFLAVLLPMLGIVAALISTMGFMTLCGQSLHLPTVIIPSFILAVGIGDAIHLLTEYFRHLRLGAHQAEAIDKALRHTGLPMLFTTLTTAAGLCSFSQAELVPIASFGIFAALGIVFAFLYTVLLLPALLAVFPVPLKASAGSNAKQPEQDRRYMTRFLEACAVLSIKSNRSIVVLGFLLFAGSGFIASQLPFSHDPLQWMPDSSKAKQSFLYVQEQVGGIIPIDIIVDAGEYDGVKRDDFMQALDQFMVQAKHYKTDDITASHTVSLVDIIKETNQALFENKAEAYVIPQGQDLIAQEFLMLETSGAEDLFLLVDRDYQRVHITLLIPWTDTLVLLPYVQGLQQLADEQFAGVAKAKVTGFVALLTRILRQVVYSTALSYVLAFVVISIMMTLLLSSIKYGLVSMIPNIMPIAVSLAAMKLMGAPLDMFSMLIGSIALGIAVDDTVHFMHRFRTLHQQTGDVEYAVRETLHSTGRAMLTTTIVLSLGFLTYLFSSMNNLQDFGIYTALCLVVALIADFLFVPALMVFMCRYRGA